MTGLAAGAPGADVTSALLTSGMVGGGAVMESVTDTVAGGPLPLALVFAVLAGLVSFLSPCVLPRVPGYLG